MTDLDIYKRIGEASRRLCDDIILEAMREASRQAETIPAPPECDLPAEDE